MDSGNTFLSAGLMSRLKAEAALEAMAAMGYDAVNIGHTDFVFGDGFILSAPLDYGVPLMSSNLVDSATRATLAPDHLVVSCGPVTVGIIGVVARRYEPVIAKFNVEGSLQIGVRDENEVLRQKIAELAGRADIIVVLADTGLTAAKQLAEDVPGMHVIVCSGGYDQTDSPLVKNGVYIVKVGSKGEGIGQLTLGLGADGDIRGAAGGIVALTAELPEDAEALSIIDAYHKGLKNYADELIRLEQVEPASGWYYAGASACASCHVPQSGQWRGTGHQKAFATLVARSQQYNPDCIACHITGYGYIGGFDLPDTTPGRGDVQCEMCHGPGGEHAETLAVPYGKTEETTCLVCHTEDHSPDFDFEAYKQKIKH